MSDEDLEWIVRLALEARWRVKEQQKRCFKSEFRNTHFSYILGAEAVEQFVSTPELHSDEALETDPLPPGQVWAASMGTPETGPGLYRVETNSGPVSGVRILNHPAPPAFRESVKVGEQNLYARATNWSVIAIRASTNSRFRCARLTRQDRWWGGFAGAGVTLRIAVGEEYAWRDDYRWCIEFGRVN